MDVTADELNDVIYSYINNTVWFIDINYTILFFRIGQTEKRKSKRPGFPIILQNYLPNQNLTKFCNFFNVFPIFYDRS